RLQLWGFIVDAPPERLLFCSCGKRIGVRRMFWLPREAAGVIDKFARAFTRPTYERFVTLLVGTIVTMGRRTVSRTLRVMQPMLQGHWSNYHRLYSSAKYSMWALAAVLVRQVVALLPADAVIELVADDTVDGKA